MQISVIGAGSWGTALTLILARNGHEVRLLAKENDSANSLDGLHENLKYLPGALLPASVTYGVVNESEPWGEAAVLAVPSSAVVSCLPYLKEYPLLCVATKGLESSGRLLSEVVTEYCPDSELTLISGPNLARELADGVPTASVVASKCEESALKIRSAFASKTFRIYVTDDVKGVELAGALKNVMAIAAGMSDGLGYGDNTNGTLVSRGLSEIARLGIALGARIETFLGVAGVGDLFATASSKLSRNYRVGYALGQGYELIDILDSLGQVAEGVPTCEAAVILAKQVNVEVPIMQHVLTVLHGQQKPRDIVSRLMERTTLHEGLGDIFH